MAKVVMLGAGFIGDFYTFSLLGMRSRDRVQVIYSRDEGRGKTFAAKHGIPKWTTSINDAVNDPDAELVVIGLPNNLHLEAVKLASAAGKGILCTKPLGRNADEAYEMLEIVEKAGVFHGYLEDLAYAPKTLKAVDAVKQGSLGARARLSRTAQLSSCLPPPHIKKNDNGYRDCIVAPLITQNALLGFLYIDVDAVYGHFTEVDRDMVGVLANQAAVAIDNAQRAHSLAQKVQERTGQLHERVDELQVINAIQQGFTAELDFQAVVDLIGNKLRQVFNTADIGIRWYDEKTNLVHYLYEYEHGERIEIPPRSPNPGGIWETINRTHQPVIFNTPNDNRDTLPIPGTDQSKSLISVPIVSSDRILGSILLENYERENASGESEVRLLTTVAASLGTVLENARLFDEAQSLPPALLTVPGDVVSKFRSSCHACGLMGNRRWPQGDFMKQRRRGTAQGIRKH